MNTFEAILLLVLIVAGAAAFAYISEGGSLTFVAPISNTVLANGNVTSARNYNAATGWFGGQELHSEVIVTFNRTAIETTYTLNQTKIHTDCQLPKQIVPCNPNIATNSTITLPFSQLTFHFTCSYYKQGDNVIVKFSFYSKSFPPLNETTYGIIGTPSGC